MKRILFFVHYNKSNNLAEYVVYLLQHIKRLYSRIIFISNSLLDDRQKSRLAGLYISIIERENKGFDFGAWKDALLQEGWDNLAAYDNVTLMNDSCFGPLYDMEIVYNKMEQQDFDFWGITDFRATNSRMPGTDGPIPFHIQSYFLCFTQKIVKTGIFKNFWERIDYKESIYSVIQEYETRLTSILKESGYRCKAFLEFTDKINTTNIVDPLLRRPDLCIINGTPLVKIKSFLPVFFPFHEELLQLIKSKTNYPVSLIIEHFSDISNEEYAKTVSKMTIHYKLYLFVKSVIKNILKGNLSLIKKMTRIIIDGLMHKMQNNSRINVENKITTLNSFANAVKMFGGTVFRSEILTEWDTDYSDRKILLVSHDLNLTGAPIALYYFAENLQKMGRQPIVISPKDGPFRSLLSEKEIPVIIYEKLYVSDIIQKSAFQFELIIVNTNVGSPIVSALNGANVPILWWIHEANVSYYQAALMAMPEQLKDNIHVYCGGSYAAAILKRYRPSYQCEQLLYFIPDYAQSLLGEDVSQIKFAEGKCVFALVGTQEERKGHDILIRAIRELPLEELKSCLFIFVGRPWYLPIKRDLSKICKEYPQNIQFIKELERKELQVLYDRIDCLICPSRDDPMPLTVTEAMLMSKIIICSENTGSAELLGSMDAGLIYRKNSPKELAALIEFVLVNRDNLSQMREQARKTYERYFSQDAFNASVKGVLQKLNDIKKSLLQYNGTVSVIIPTYNGGEELRSLIEILNNQIGIGKVELIIVDSGSKDDTAELAEKLGAVVLRITQAEFSHSYARNIGATNATGEYLLFMTQDALPSGITWMRGLIQPALHDNVAAVSCRQIPKPGCDLFGRITVWSYNEYLGILQSDRILSLPNNNNYDNLRKNGQIDDITCLIRKDVFMQFLYRGNYAEDLDLGIRLIQAGYQMSLLSSVQVIHSHTRPAVYHLKRCIMEFLALKKILPDFPIQEIDTQPAINKIITAYCATIYLVRYLIETCEARESFSDFCRRIKRRFSHILSIIKKMKFDKINNLIEEDTKYFDAEIRVFIQKLLACYNIVTYDPSLASDQIYFITHTIHRYLESTGEEFSSKFKLEICDLLIKRFGQMAGSLLAAYLVWHLKEKNSLADLIGEYSSGV
jgi:glycosyltransferase involved in cell wall biosynthesis